MNVAFINPFIESTLRSLEMMASITAEKIGLSVKEDLITTYDISAIIGITGGDAALLGTAVIEEIATLDQSVEDAVGEIGNIVVGDARRLLIQDGFSLSISVPTVVVGKGHKISRSGDVPCIAIPFKTEFGEFEVNVGLKE